MASKRCNLKIKEPLHNAHVVTYYYFYTWLCDKLKRPLAQITYYTAHQLELNPDWCPYKEMDEAERQNSTQDPFAYGSTRYGYSTNSDGNNNLSNQ